MGLYLASQDDLSAMLSVAAGVTITSANYTVIGIRATTSADLPASGGKNTKARVSMAAGATQRGTVDVYYDRLDLAQLANYSPIKSFAAAGTDVSALLTTLRDMYGINFTMADLVDASTVDDGSGTGSTSLTLTAAASSIGWMGTVTLGFAPLPDISTAFISAILPGF